MSEGVATKNQQDFFTVVSAIAKFIEDTDKKMPKTDSAQTAGREDDINADSQ